MPTYRADNAECWIFTFKEGLLSKIAHDLKIRVGTFEVTVEEGRVEGTFDPTSLRVECARQDGRDSPSTLSASDKKKIEGNIQKDVLETKRHRDVRFVSSEVAIEGERATVKGDLTLHGTTRPITATVQKSDGRWVTELRLHQPDFGIKPYSAMLGTLKVQPTLTVQLSVPAE
ncbi:MAG: YceI family protein [Myxococcota bacterium]